MGGCDLPLTREKEKKVVADLINFPAYLGFIASVDDEFVGMCDCFYGYSTFNAAPLINIHDVFVDDRFKGRGIGTALLEAVENEAKESGCCKITLEVREDNSRAQEVYQRFGFSDGDPKMFFWSKSLK